jgi:SAM-dependent methyltransferase
VSEARCPLCGTSSARPVGVFSYDRIRLELQSVWGVEIDPDIWRANVPAETTRLLRCGGCGLERFDPIVPGSVAFYEQLMAAMPYNGDRWEFGVVARGLRPDDDVLDLGCGDGAFLLSLGARPGRTAGLDHNGEAIARLVSRGFEAHAGELEAFARSQPASFDVVTAFHLIEHVDDPVALVRTAVACLRPGGRLFVSVPNRERSYRSEDEPLDCPPHHVTRWSERQLGVLARQLELELRAVRYEPPDLSTVRELAKRRAAAHLRGLPPGPRDLAVRTWGKAAIGPRRHDAMTRRGSLAARGLFGHAMLAELAVPPPSASQRPQRLTTNA